MYLVFKYFLIKYLLPYLNTFGSIYAHLLYYTFGQKFNFEMWKDHWKNFYTFLTRAPYTVAVNEEGVDQRVVYIRSCILEFNNQSSNFTFPFMSPSDKNTAHRTVPNANIRSAGTDLLANDEAFLLWRTRQGFLSLRTQLGSPSFKKTTRLSFF